MIESSIHLLLRLIVILLALLALSSMYLFVMRQIEVVRNGKIFNYKKAVLPEWIDFLNGVTDFSCTLIPRTKEEIVAVEEILLSYLHNVRSPGLLDKISNFANHHMISHYRKMLRSLNWSVRMNALYRIVDFQMDGMKLELERFERRKLSKEERFQLLKFKALFSKEQFFHDFTANQQSYSEYELKKLLMNVDHKLLEDLILRFDEFTPQVQHTLMDVIGVKQDSIALPFIELKMQSNDPELRIRALKAAFEIGLAMKLEILAPFVHSDYWEERMMAAKLFRSIDFEHSYPHLMQLLADQSWWVRYQAARTILKHRNGKETLQEFIRFGKDRYAVDMAIEALSKEGEELG